ncbi:hypothetical protein QJQ45_000856 [Haematococcus lacustris]|nr:hypothetical protein QJQ45_000856 [Haematococcus lacustris]
MTACSFASGLSRPVAACGTTRGSKRGLPLPFGEYRRQGAPCQAKRGDGKAMGTDDPLRALEVAVPQDQRPANELKQLKEAQLYSWATLPEAAYLQRLALIFLFFFAFVGGPISYQTFDPLAQPLLWGLSATVGSLVIVAIAVVRIYLGWSYVGDRLMSAAGEAAGAGQGRAGEEEEEERVEYEESGWYDGEVFVKPPELLTRDRLLGMYEVKPVMAKLRTTLIGSGLALALCASALAGAISSSTDADGMYGRGAGKPRVTSDGLIFSSKVSDLSQLKEDDELAAAEAASLGGMPGYCADRVLRAAAGGQYCGQYDQQRR